MSDGTAFSIDFPEFILLKKPYSFWQQCQILQIKVLQNAIDLATIALSFLKNSVKYTDYLLLFFPMISLVSNSMVDLTCYWLNQ